MPPNRDDKQYQDDKYNPALNRQFQDLKAAEEQAGDYGDADQTADDLQQRESSNLASSFKNSFTGQTNKKAGRKAGIFGGVSLIIITAVTGFFVNQIGMSLPRIAQPIDDANNALADAYENRAPKVLSRMLGGGDLCANTEAGLRCKTSKVSNKTLHLLSKKGISASFADGTTYKSGTTKGFPDSKPTHYSFTDSRTGQVRNVAAKDLPGFLRDPKNFEHTAKMIGRTGAFHVRAEVMRGKVLNNLFGKFNMKFTGAKGYEKHPTAKATYESAYKNMQKDTPSVDSVSDATKGDAINKKFDAMSKRLGRGGAAYMTLAGGCMLVKAPSIIAASVTAVQLARVAPVFNNLILSPASQQKVSGVDTKNAIQPGQLAAIMTVLTQETPRPSDGKMTSALDSDILLSVMGVNKGKPAINPDTTPGYSILNSSFVVGGQSIDKTTEPYCNFMLNPMTMYTFATADAAVSIGSGFVSGGIGTALTKVASEIVQFGISYAATEGAKIVADKAVQQIVADIVKKNVFGTASGEELGDVLGIGAMTIYSSASLARGVPALYTSQLSSWTAVQAEVDDQQRRHDIATLSPFDTSSKYTLLGSLAHSMQRFALANQLYTNSSAYSIASALTSLPSFAFGAPTAGAVIQAENCSYASEFGLDTGDPATTPAINAAGLPCTGITQQQSNMSVDRAIDIMNQEGWVNTGADYPEDATPEELIGTVIEEDSPVATYIETCGHPENGNMLFNSSGCAFPGSGVGTSQEAIDNNSNYCAVHGCAESNGDSVANNVSVESMRAIPVFLMDFQLSQIIQGINSDPETAPAPSDNSDTPADGGQVTGDAAELAQQLLDSSNVTFWDQPRDAGDKSRPSDNLRSIAAGELANTSTRGPAGGQQTTIDINLLKFLVELSQTTDIMINSLVGQSHSDDSLHYKGLAVDFNCGDSLAGIADPIAKKYGLERNWENCTPAGNNHWHYSVK